MPKSSTHRLLSELAALGIVRHTEDGRYSLGPRLLYWGEAAAETFDLRAIAEPTMRRLRDELGESVHLYIRDEDTRICIAAVEARHELRPFIQLGRPLPLRAGAAGKVLLAFAEEDVQRQEFERADPMTGAPAERPWPRPGSTARCRPRRTMGDVDRRTGERRGGQRGPGDGLDRSGRGCAVHLGTHDSPHDRSTGRDARTGPCLRGRGYGSPAPGLTRAQVRPSAPGSHRVTVGT